MKYAVAVAMAVLGSGVGSVPARAAPGDQLLKLTSDDAAPQDLFGGATPADVDDRTTHGISLYGNRAIIGAPADDTTDGDDAGSAYLFDLTTGQQLVRLTADDAGPGQTFGSAVGIQGDHVVVGAAHNVEGSTVSGAAYLFDAHSGSPRFKLTPEDAFDGFDGFGWSVDIHDDIAIVGAPLHPQEGRPVGGSAYLFDVTTGQQLHKLTPETPAPENEDWFGISVSINGDTAIVGAWGDGEFGDFSGAAYLFDVATGQQRNKLTAPEADPFEQFGHSVSIHGSRAVVGAPNDDNENGDYSGIAYVFDVSTGQLLHTLMSDDAETEDRFGWSVATSGNAVMVGATGNGDHGFFSGSAYVFDAVTGEQQLKLLADDGAADDNFGWAVALDRDRALVAAPMDDDACLGDAQCQSGSAYVFAVGSPPWMAGDANQDLSFDQLDVVQVSQAAKYLTDLPATWGEGDWNGASTGSPGDPPAGDGRFNQLDIVAALATGNYLTGPYAALSQDRKIDDLAVIGSLEGGGSLGPADRAFLPVPEPSSAVLLALATTLLLVVRRHPRTP